MLKHEWNDSALLASHFQFCLRFLFLILVHRQLQTSYAQPASEQNHALNLGFTTKLRWELPPAPFCCSFTAFLNLCFCFSLLIEYGNIHFQFCSTCLLFLKLQFRCHCWLLISTACSPALCTWPHGCGEEHRRVKEKISSLHFSVQNSSGVNQHSSADNCFVSLKSSDLTMGCACAIWSQCGGTSLNALSFLRVGAVAWESACSKKTWRRGASKSMTFLQAGCYHSISFSSLTSIFGNCFRAAKELLL